MAKQVELEWLNDDDTNDSAQVGGQKPSRSFMDTIGDAINAIGANFDVVRGSNRIGDLMESLAEPDWGTTEEQYYQNLDKLQKEYEARELAQRRYQDAQDRLVAEDSFLKNITQMGGTLEGMAAQAIGTAGGAALGSIGGLAGASTGAKIGNALGAATGGYLDARSVALEAREKVLEEGGTLEQAQEAYEEALKKASLTTIPETAIDIILGNRLLGSVSGRIGSSTLLDPAAKIGTRVSRAFNPLAGRLAGFATDVALQGSTEALQEVTQDYIANREIAKALNRPDNEYSLEGFGQYAITPEGLETMKTAGIMGALFGGIGGTLSSGQYLQHGAKTREGNMTYHAVKNMEKNGDLYINPDNREAEIQTLAEILEKDGVDEGTIRGWSDAELAAASAEVRGKHVARISPLEAQDKSIVRQAADFGNRVLSTDEHRNLKESDLTPESRKLLKYMGIEDGMVDDMFSPKRGKNILDTTKKEEKTESSEEAKPVVKLTQPTIESMEQGQQKSGMERKTDGVIDDFTLEFGSENDIGENWEKISQGDVQYEDTAIYRNRDNGRIVSVQKTRDGKIQVVDHGFNTDQDKLFNINNFESLPKQQYSSAKEAKQKLLDNDDNKADFRWQRKTNEQKQQQENHIDNTKNIANDIASLAKLHKAGIINDGAFLEFSALLQRAGMTKNEHNIDFQFLPDEISEGGYAQRDIDKSVGRAIVRLYYGADIGSVVHELGHNAYWNLPQEQRDLFNYYAVKSCGNFVANICGENYTQDFVNRLKSGDKKLWEKVRKSSAIKQTRFLLKSTDVVKKGIMSQEEYNFLRQQAIEERYAHELSAWYVEGYTRGIEPQNIKERIMQRGCISVANELGVLQKVYDYVHHKGGDYGDTPIEEMYKNAYGGFTGATYSTLADQSNLYLGEELNPLEKEEVKKAPEPKPTENKNNKQPKTEYTEEQKAQNEEDKKIQNRKTIDVKGRYKEQQKEKVSDVINQFDQKSQNEVDKLIDIIKNKKSGWQKAIQKLSNYSPSLYMDKLNGIQNSSDQSSLYSFTKTYNNLVIEEKKESTQQPTSKKGEKKDDNKPQAKPSSETQAKQNELFNQTEQKDPNLGKDGMAVYNKLKDKKKLSKNDKAEIKGIIDRIDALGGNHRLFALRKSLDNLLNGVKQETSQEPQQQKSNIEKAITEKPKTLGDSPAARAVKLIKKIENKNVMDIDEADYFVNELLSAVTDLKNWNKEFDGKQSLIGQLKNIIDKIKKGDFFGEEIEEESSVQKDTTNSNNEQQEVQTPAPVIETAQPVQEVAQQPQENILQNESEEQRLARLEEELKKLSTTRQIKSRLNKYLNNKDITQQEYDTLSDKLFPKEQPKAETENTTKTSSGREYIAYAKDKDGNLQTIKETHKSKKDFADSLRQRKYVPQFVAKGEEEFNNLLSAYNKKAESKKAKTEEKDQAKEAKRKAREAAKKAENERKEAEAKAKAEAKAREQLEKEARAREKAEKKAAEKQAELEAKKREEEERQKKVAQELEKAKELEGKPLPENIVDDVLDNGHGAFKYDDKTKKIGYYEQVDDVERGINPHTGGYFKKLELRGLVDKDTFFKILDKWNGWSDSKKEDRVTPIRGIRASLLNGFANNMGWVRSETRAKPKTETPQQTTDNNTDSKTQQQGQSDDSKKSATNKKPAKPKTESKTETDPFKALHKKFKNVTGGEIGKTTVYKADEKAFIKAWMGRVDDAITSKKETLNDIIKSLEEWKQNNIDQKRTDVIYDYIQNYVIEAGKQFPNAVQNSENKDTRNQMSTQRVKQAQQILNKAFPDTRFQYAWHSTRHNFTEFTLNNLLGGEGAMAHGWGLYFGLEWRKNKKYYFDRFRFQMEEWDSEFSIYGDFDAWDELEMIDYLEDLPNEIKPKIKQGSDIIKTLIPEIKKLEEEIEEIKEEKRKHEDNLYENEYYDEEIGKIQPELDRLNSLVKVADAIDYLAYNPKDGIKFLLVDIPDNDVLLIEGRGFAAQPPKVKRALMKLARQEKLLNGEENTLSNKDLMEHFDEILGINEDDWFGDVYNTLAWMLEDDPYGVTDEDTTEQGKERASKLLNKYGIKGILYDGNRDGKCAVIFDDKSIDILSKFKIEEDQWERTVGNNTRNIEEQKKKAQNKLQKRKDLARKKEDERHENLIKLANSPSYDTRFQLHSEKGMPKADINSPAFKEWFKGSILKNKDGSPKVFYRGIRGHYDPTYDKEEGGAVWISEERQFAEDFRDVVTYEDVVKQTGKVEKLSYIDRGSNIESGDLAEVYASVKKPFNVEQIMRFDSNHDQYVHIGKMLGRDVEKGIITAQQRVQVLRDLSYLNKMTKRGTYPNVGHVLAHHFKDKRFFDAFKKVGYDSIQGYESDVMTYGVFDKGNVKSIYNKGTFNRNDKDIRNMAIGEFGKNSPLANKEFKNKLEQAWEKSYRKWGHRLNYSNEEIEESLNKYKNIEDEKVFDRDQDKLAEIYARLNDYVNRDFWRQGIGKDVEGTRARFRRELDGRWRFYIPDNKMQFKPRVNNLLKLKNTGKKLTLDQVIKHDLLFKYYPDLKKIEVEICDSTYDKELKDSTSAYYDENEETIVLNAKDLSGDIKEVQRTMLHEIQHIIQDEEGFAQGGSPEDFAGHQKQLTSFAKGIFKKKEEFRRHLLNNGFDEKTIQAKLDTYFFKDEKSLENIIKNTLNKNPSGKFGKEFKNWIASNNKVYNEYKNLLGEIEARDTEKRFDYTDEQLQFNPPMIYNESINSLKYDKNGKVIARKTRDKRAIKDSRNQLKSEKGMPIADTNTNAFRKWFGNSTAINSDGSPRVFYRGQGHEYDPNYKFDKTDANRNKLTWVAQTKQFIEDGAYNGLDGEGDLWEVYIRTENPFNMGLIDSSTDEAEKTPMELYEHVINKLKREVKYRRITPKQFEETKEKLSYLRQNRRSDGKIQNYKSPIYYFLDKDTKFVGALKDLGYDSILGIEDDTNTFALFDPNQIKSIYNDGTWDSPNDIRSQERGFDPQNVIKDKNGNPKTFYRGILHTNNRQYDKNEGGVTWFSEDKKFAEAYARGRDGGLRKQSSLIEGNLSVKNPFDFGTLGNEYTDRGLYNYIRQLLQEYVKNGNITKEQADNIINKLSYLDKDDEWTIMGTKKKRHIYSHFKKDGFLNTFFENGFDAIGGKELGVQTYGIQNNDNFKETQTKYIQTDERYQKMSKKERKKEQKEYVKREISDAIEKGEITDTYKDVYSVSFDESAQNNGENQKKMKYFNDRSEFWDRHESNGTVTYTRKTPFEHHQKVIKYSGINGVQKTMKEKSKPRQWYEWFKDQAIKYLFNDKQYLAKLARHLGVYDAYTRMMVTEGYAQRANVALTEGILYNGKRTRALNDIIKTVGYQKQKRFLDYCIAHRILNLKERDPKIEQKMSLEEAKEIIEREQNSADAKLFEDNRVDFVDYNKALLHVLVDGGIISEDTFQKFCKNDPDFVPLAKVLDGADLGFNSIIHAHSLINVKSPVKKIGTSMREVKNPFLEMQKRTAEYYSIAARNRAGQIFVNEICGKLDTMFDGDTVQRGAGIIRKVRVDEQNGKLITKPDDQKQIIYVCNNGKHEFYQVADREIYLALKSLSDDQMNTLTKMIDRVAHAPASLVREGATIVPDFGVRNLIRDNFEAFLTSEHGFIPFFDAMWGMYQMANNTEWYQRYLDQVGEYGTLNRESQRVDNLATYSSTIDDKISYAQNLKEIYKEQMAIIKDTNKAYSDVINEKNSPQRKLLAFMKLFVSPIWAGGKSLKRFNDYMEQGTRIGEFKNAKKKYEGLLDRLGKDALKWNIGFDAINDNSDIMAAGAAKEITLNFAQHGSLGKMINRWVPFFNATMQGVYKFGNTMDLLFKGNDMSNNKNRRLQKELAFKTALMVAFGIGVAAAGDGDEDYDEAPEWEKKNFWIFPNGMRLPKDQVLGTIVGTAAEESYRQWRKGKAEPSKLLEIICEHFSPNNITPTIVDTIFVGFMANYDSFKKQDIVPEYMKQRRGFLQKDLNTANVAVAISEALYNTLGWDISAKKIDYAITKNLSNTAKYMNAILDLGLAKNEKMARGYDKSDSTGAFVGGLRDRVPTPLNLVTGTFATNRTSYQSINEFYDKYNKLKIASSHEQSMTEEEKRLWNRYQKAYKEDTKLRKQLREIKNNASLNKDQKREKADPIFKKQIKLAKWAEGE